MKTFQLIPAFRNVEELQKIVDLVRIHADPVKVILFGQYAGMQLCSALGGYELLVVTRTNSKTSSLELQRYVDQQLLPEERHEKRLFIYALPFELLQGKHHTNYFFYQICLEGYLLYEDKDYPLWRRPGFKQSLVLRSVQRDSSRCVELGKQFLEEAGKQLMVANERMAAFAVYQALRQFLLAVVWGCYGFEPYEENSLVSDYSLVRHASEKLSKLWNLDDPQSKKVLNRLHAFNRTSRFARNFNVPEEKLAEYIGIVQHLAEETEKVCKDRIQLLTASLEKEIESSKKKEEPQEKENKLSQTDEKALPL